MTNYSVKGGPAVPAKVVTSGASQGGPAIPVYQILTGDGNTWAIADFQALIDYLVTLDIVVLTADEIYRLNTQTITHKHRID